MRPSKIATKGLISLLDEYWRHLLEDFSLDKTLKVGYTTKVLEYF